jgi:hypothetical protein
MLKRLGWDEERVEAQKAAERAATNSSIDTSKSQDENINDSQSSSELEHDEVQISSNEAGDIIACSVTVNNNTTSKYSGISVAFELTDGTLVPGEGPDALAPNSSAEYLMPADLLPLSLEPAKDNKKRETLVSKVLIHATPSENP